jgi:hypothetical protein
MLQDQVPERRNDLPGAFAGVTIILSGATEITPEG